MVEPAEDGYGDDASVLGKAMAVLQERSGHSLGRFGDAGSERGVRSCPIVEIGELEESASQMVLGERDQEVEALTAEGSDESLAKSVGLGSPGRGLEDFASRCRKTADSSVSGCRKAFHRSCARGQGSRS